MKKFLGVFTKSNARAASPEDVAKVTVVNKLECVASLSRKTSAGLVTGMYGPPQDCKGKFGREDKSAQMYSAFGGGQLSWP